MPAAGLWSMIAAPRLDPARLFERVSVDRECRKRLSDTLLKTKSCRGQSDTEQRALAYEVLRCHLHNSGKERPPPLQSYASLDDVSFALFTSFLIDVERICFELSHDRYLNSVESLVDELLSQTHSTSQSLYDLGERQADLLLAVTDGERQLLDMTARIEEGLSLSSEILRDGQAALRADLAASLSNEEHLLGLQQEAGETQRRLLVDLGHLEDGLRGTLDHVSPALALIQQSTQQTNMSIASFQMFAFYLAAGLMLRCVTGFACTGRARLRATLCFVASLLAEALLVRPACGSMDAASTDAWAWRTRYVFLVLGLAAIAAAMRRVRRELTRDDAEEIILQIQANARVAGQAERLLLDGLVDDLARSRAAKQFAAAWVCAEGTTKLLSAPPPGYLSAAQCKCKMQCPADAPAPMPAPLLQDAIGDPWDGLVPHDAAPVEIEEIFAPEEYGWDVAHAISGL